MINLLKNFCWKQRCLGWRFGLCLTIAYVLFHPILSIPYYLVQPQLEGENLKQIVDQQRHRRLIEKEIGFLREWRRQAVPILVDQLRYSGSSQETLRTISSVFFRFLPDSLRHRLATWHSGDYNDYTLRREGASWALLCMKEDSSAAFSALRKAWNDPSPIVRQNAAAAFGFFQSKSAFRACRKAMEDPSSVVRYKAVESLWRLTGTFPEAGLELAKARNDPAPFVADYARMLLKRAG